MSHPFGINAGGTAQEHQESCEHNRGRDDDPRRSQVRHGDCYRSRGEEDQGCELAAAGLQDVGVPIGGGGMHWRTALVRLRTRLVRLCLRLFRLRTRLARV